MFDRAAQEQRLVTVGVARTESDHQVGAAPSDTSIAATDADWMANWLLFLCRWIEESEAFLDEDLDAWTENRSYRSAELLADLDRAISLVGFQRIRR